MASTVIAETVVGAGIGYPMIQRNVDRKTIKSLLWGGSDSSVPIWKNVITQLVFISRGAVDASTDTGAFMYTVLFSVIEALSSFIRPDSKF